MQGDLQAVNRLPQTFLRLAPPQLHHCRAPPRSGRRPHRNRLQVNAACIASSCVVTCVQEISEGAQGNALLCCHHAKSVAKVVNCGSRFGFLPAVVQSCGDADLSPHCPSLAVFVEWIREHRISWAGGTNPQSQSPERRSDARGSRWMAT